jgi:hypothetical protein
MVITSNRQYTRRRELLVLRQINSLSNSAKSMLYFLRKRVFLKSRGCMAVQQYVVLRPVQCGNFTRSRSVRGLSGNSQFYRDGAVLGHKSKMRTKKKENLCPQHTLYVSIVEASKNTEDFNYEVQFGI